MSGAYTKITMISRNTILFSIVRLSGGMEVHWYVDRRLKTMNIPSSLTFHGVGTVLVLSDFVEWPESHCL